MHRVSAYWKNKSVTRLFRCVYDAIAITFIRKMEKATTVERISGGMRPWMLAKKGPKKAPS